MDNRFKFRAWLMAENRMIVVDIMDSDGDIFCYDQWGESVCFHDGIHDYILMQCTGLLATSSYRGESEEDRLIFEGDILDLAHESGTNLVVIVEWRSGSYVCEVDFDTQLFDVPILVDMCDTIKIIGNIHERPDLLAQAK